MKNRAIQSTVIPKGWTGKTQSYNGWMMLLQKQIDKVMNTNLAEKLR